MINSAYRYLFTYAVTVVSFHIGGPTNEQGPHSTRIRGTAGQGQASNPHCHFDIIPNLLAPRAEPAIHVTTVKHATGPHIHSTPGSVPLHRTTAPTITEGFAIHGSACYNNRTLPLGRSQN
jgi:hypothetical protein